MRILRLVATISVSLMAAFAAASTTADPASYLFTYFTGNGEDGLHLAWSTDGYKWEALNGGKSYLMPKVGKAKLMRNPCIVRAPDGAFHMVWTSGWNENNIGYAFSNDLIHWSEQKEIPVMAHEPSVRNCWAPEIAYDLKRRQFIIFWASTIPGRFPSTAGSSEDAYNHRMYFTTTQDFVTFTPSSLFYDPGFSVIDATLLTAKSRHYLIVKDETRDPPRKHLRIAVSDDMQGPFTDLSPPFTPLGLWAEGPTALKVGDDFIVYYDAYVKKHYGAMRTRNFKAWEDVTSKLFFPNENTIIRMRHGTAIEVPTEVVINLRKGGAN